MRLDADRKTVTAVVALFLTSYVLTFLVGYYAGKKSALDEFSENIKQDAFSDRVYASLYTLAESQDGEAQETTVVEQVESPDVGVTSQDAGTVSTEDSAEEKLYYAVLVGFGARSSADKYVNSLKNRGVSARSIERTSTTSRGSKRSWYQVVTEPASLEQAQEWVHRISTTDKLQGVVIKEYEKTT